MTKVEATKLLSGTISRGFLWAVGGLCQALGVGFVQAENAEWAQGAAIFIVGTLFEVVAGWWSRGKDQKLIDS